MCITFVFDQPTMRRYSNKRMGKRGKAKELARRDRAKASYRAAQNVTFCASGDGMPAVQDFSSQRKEMDELKARVSELEKIIDLHTKSILVSNEINRRLCAGEMTHCNSHSADTRTSEPGAEETKRTEGTKTPLSCGYISLPKCFLCEKVAKIPVSPVEVGDDHVVHCLTCYRDAYIPSPFNHYDLYYYWDDDLYDPKNKYGAEYKFLTELYSVLDDAGVVILCQRGCGKVFKKQKDYHKHLCDDYQMHVSR